jgi:hypothetical protein
MKMIEDFKNKFKTRNYKFTNLWVDVFQWVNDLQGQVVSDFVAELIFAWK